MPGEGGKRLARARRDLGSSSGDIELLPSEAGSTRQGPSARSWGQDTTGDQHLAPSPLAQGQCLFSRLILEDAPRIWGWLGVTRSK